MDEDDSSIHSIETLESMPIPSCSKESDDSRINCTDHQSLCNIVKITLAQVSEFEDSLTLKDNRSEFIAHFNEFFTNALQENIVINGLPWIMEQSKLTSPQKEDHKQMVDDALLAKLSKAVSDVAHKRKFCPEQCCRILNIKTKHELQNLKKAKISNDFAPCRDVSVTTLRRNKAKPFVDFSKEFKTLQEDVHHEIKKRKELEMQMSLAYDLQTSNKRKSNKVTKEACMLKL